MVSARYAQLEGDDAFSQPHKTPSRTLPLRCTYMHTDDLPPAIYLPSTGGHTSSRFSPEVSNSGSHFSFPILTPCSSWTASYSRSVGGALIRMGTWL